MNNLNELKALLHDIKPLNSKTEKTNNIDIISYYENPLNPNLLSYCFDIILGFDVQYRIFEKVNYIIEFDYKGSYGYVSHQKTSFDMRIDKKYKSELIELFEKAKGILSNIFQEFGNEALNNNEFTMENEYYHYKEKLDFFSNKIFAIEEKQKQLEEEQKAQMQNWNSNDDFVTRFNALNHISREYRLDGTYAIETYIDTFYSFLEHVLTLLYPFTPNFNLAESYGIKKIHNPRWTWDKKFIAASCGNQELIGYIDELREIKEVYRNRNAHGMFSRELKVYAQIHKFGRYPIYLGKNYLKGFIDEQLIWLDFEKFLKIKKTFDSFMNKLHEAYPIPMIFIEGGACIPVDVAILTKGVQDEDAAKQLLNRYHYMIDNQSNMDW